MCLLIKAIDNGRRFIKMQFACEIEKLMSDRKTRCSPLNAENNQGVINDVVFTYVHQKVNILLSVLSIFLSFL